MIRSRIRDKLACALAAMVLNLLFGLRAAFAHTGDVFFARAGKPSEIDGDLGDWPEDTWREATHSVEDMAEFGTASDFRAWYSVMWEGDRLYLAAKVLDNRHEDPRPGYIKRGDYVRFTFIPSHTRSVWSAPVEWMYAHSANAGTVNALCSGYPGSIEQMPAGFELVAQHTVCTAEGNTRSIRIPERFGCRHEGLIENGDTIHGELIDLVVFSKYRS